MTRWRGALWGRGGNKDSRHHAYLHTPLLAAEKMWWRRLASWKDDIDSTARVTSPTSMARSGAGVCGDAFSLPSHLLPLWNYRAKATRENTIMQKGKGRAKEGHARHTKRKKKKKSIIFRTSTSANSSRASLMACERRHFMRCWHATSVEGVLLPPPWLTFNSLLL